jgi:alkanesulfonate monooxygenase SsuD/methylene tetrahydromethanopterin reductase-like flavin-dependent oxidoreductase (luciferase family)
LIGDRGEEAPLRAHLTALARTGRITDRSGFVGTAEEFADLIEELGEWGNDGVLLWGDFHPVTLHRTLDELVPVLRRRGILRREYADGGLQANLRAF